MFSSYKYENLSFPQWPLIGLYGLIGFYGIISLCGLYGLIGLICYLDLYDLNDPVASMASMATMASTASIAHAIEAICNYNSWSVETTNFPSNIWAKDFKIEPPQTKFDWIGHCSNAAELFEKIEATSNGRPTPHFSFVIFFVNLSFLWIF